MGFPAWHEPPPRAVDYPRPPGNRASCLATDTADVSAFDHHDRVAQWRRPRAVDERGTDDCDGSRLPAARGWAEKGEIDRSSEGHPGEKERHPVRKQRHVRHDHTCVHCIFMSSELASGNPKSNSGAEKPSTELPSQGC